jgi:sugar phosphate isomerase/epimerase
MTSVTFRGKSIEEVASLAKAAGLSEIEWGGDVHVPPADEAAIRRALSAMKENNLRCSSYGSYYRVGDNDEGAFRNIVKTAKALGASIIRVWLGRIGSLSANTEYRSKILEESKRLSAIAAEYGATVAFEFHGKTLNDTGEASISFLKDCACENIKTYWQPLSYSDNEANLRAVLPYLVAVHVFTWDDEYRRYPLSDGESAWKRYLSILNEAKISVPLIMEFVKDDSEEQFLEDAAFLKALADT